MTWMKETIKNGMEFSTFHAIPNIARTKRTSIKVMWILILILSSAACGLLVLKTIVQYFNFEVVTKFSVVYENPTKFPTVTVCNINPYVTEEAFEFFDEFMSKLGFNETHQPVFGMKSTSKFLGEYFDLRTLQYMALGHQIGSRLPKEKLESMGLPADKFFIICAFKSEECNYTQLTHFFDPMYGNCWKFNSGQDSQGNKIDIQTTSQPGIFEGLLLFLNVGVPDNWLTFSYKTGVRVFINNHSVEPTTYDGIEAAPGFQTNFQVNREFIYKLPVPYNDCYKTLDKEDAFDSDLYRDMISFNKSYRQVDCFRLCLQKAISKNCECFNPYDRPLYSNTPCQDAKQMTCVIQEYSKFYSQDAFKQCGHLCPRECDSVMYSYSTSFSSLSSKSFDRFLNRSPAMRELFPGQQITPEFIKENIAAINVYYDETKYTRIEEIESMVIEDLISNIGGTLGVFLGISFLSLIEFIELAIELIAIAIARRKKRKSVQLAPKKLQK